MMEQAIRITPYDDDLRDDANRIAEKVRMETLIAASTGGGGGSGKKNVEPGSQDR
jgi:dyslexia susceptibility 1 candidate gene 1 protein